jgi:hypothetical protein
MWFFQFNELLFMFQKINPTINLMNMVSKNDCAQFV